MYDVNIKKIILIIIYIIPLLLIVNIINPEKLHSSLESVEEVAASRSISYDVNMPIGKLKVPGYISSSVPRTHCSKKESSENSSDIAPYNVQLVIVYPREARSPYKRYKNTMSSDARFVDQYMQYQSKGKRSISWDQGGVCGSRKLDIISKKLKFTSRTYKRMDPSTLFHQVYDELTAEGLISNGKNLVVYGYKLRTSLRKAGSIIGIADNLVDDRPGLDNSTIKGGLMAMVLGDGGSGFASYKDKKNRRRYVLAHELMHTLGAVQKGSPNSTSNGHCVDAYDLMCYKDISDKKMKYKCQAKKTSLDCNSNDYFSVEKRESRWLKKHWNVADSPYLIGSSYREKLLG